MDTVRSREIRLASRPAGRLTPEHFSLAEVAVAHPADGQVLVRNLFMSVDPYMRTRMNAVPSYVAPFEVGRTLDGGAVGEVVESRTPGLAPGAIVVSDRGWREWFTAAAAEVRAVGRDAEPLSLHLGALGMPGMTAWVGWQLVGIEPGETVYVSGAAGAVGHVAGQLARIRGCRVIGSAGSADKTRFLREACGFDAAFDYREGSIVDQLKLAAPDGIDAYFDNTGGPALEAALSALRLHGRIVACGAISAYNSDRPRRGPANLFNVITKRLTMRGFIVHDWEERRAEFEAEVGAHVRTGRLRARETVVTGIEHAVEACIGLFEGQNVGKMIVKLV
jgi:NADPH-dependent curcumin reductase CurA